MNRLKRLTTLLEKKADLLYLLNRHAQNKEAIWEGDEEGFTDYVNAALDEIIAINKEIKYQYPEKKITETAQLGINCIVMLNTSLLKIKSNKVV